MRDVNSGWLIRYTHANVASFFFIFVYAHIGRNLYYGSYQSPRVLPYSVGVIILVVMMATAFLGCEHGPKCYKIIIEFLLSGTISDVKATDVLISTNHFFLIHIANISNTLRSYSNTISPLSNSTVTVAAGTGTAEGYSHNNLTPSQPKIYSTEVEKFLMEFQLNPVFVYEDLHLEQTKKRIKSDVEGLSGVYLIFNKTTSDFYVGSAATDKFYSRFVNHLYYFIGSKIVKLAVRKYGLSNFSFIVLELFPEIVDKENNKKLLDLEDFYLKSLLPNYNILTEAGNSFGYKHTEITRLKMTQNYSQERREKIGNLNKNKNLSPETIEKLRKAALSRTKPIYTEEALNNMKKNSKAIIIYNLDKTVYGEFLSIVEAAKSLKCGEKTIRRALKGETKFLKRKWIVAYSNQPANSNK